MKCADGRANLQKAKPSTFQPQLARHRTIHLSSFKPSLQDRSSSKLSLTQVLVNSNEICHLPNLNAALRATSSHRFCTSQRNHTAERCSGYQPLVQSLIGWCLRHFKSLHQVCKWIEQTRVGSQDPIRANRHTSACSQNIVEGPLEQMGRCLHNGMVPNCRGHFGGKAQACDPWDVIYSTS